MEDSRAQNRRPATESALLEGCRKGDLRAFEHLFQQLGPRMKSIALNRLGNRSDAEDAVQEAFLRIYRNLDSFRGRSAFSTWVYRIVSNACHDFRRTRQRRRAEVEVPDLQTLEDPRKPSKPQDHPLRLSLEKSLRQLPARQRTAFILFEVEGFPHREIAEMLDCSEAASRVLLFEAKKNLRELLRGQPREGR